MPFQNRKFTFDASYVSRISCRLDVDSLLGDIQLTLSCDRYSETPTMAVALGMHQVVLLTTVS